MKTCSAMVIGGGRDVGELGLAGRNRLPRMIELEPIDDNNWECTRHCAVDWMDFMWWSVVQIIY